MSVTFTKLFSSITESTVWAEPAGTRIVWIAMLAMADRCGRVWATIPGLANRARVSLEETETALKTFLSPDKYSRTKDFDGRRIEEIDGGWVLLNHAKYRDIRDEEGRREYQRDWQRKRREMQSTNDSGQSQSTHTDADADAKAEAYTKKIKASEKARLNRPAFLRHQSAINYGNDGGVCGHEAIY